GAARRTHHRPRCVRAAAGAHAGPEMGPDRQRAGPQRAHPSNNVGSVAGVLPWPGRPHDQLLSATMIRGLNSDAIVGALSGLAAGYMLWLVAIWIGEEVTTVSVWSVIVFLGSAILAVVAAAWGWSLRRRHKDLWATFAFGLPILPVVLTLAVLADIANI